MPQLANLITDLDPSTAGLNMQLGTDRVAVLTLGRPDCLNALDGSIFVRVTEELERIAADPTVRALVVTGANGAFSAGADLNVIEWFAKHPQADSELVLNHMMKAVAMRDQTARERTAWN
jgi:enoyl-CoA hydratase/carnithine racemase